MPILLELMVSKLEARDDYLPLRKKQYRVIFPVIKHLINERFKPAAKRLDQITMDPTSVHDIKTLILGTDMLKLIKLVRIK